MKNEKIEEIVQNLINNRGFQHTLKLVPSSQRELFISEIERHLLSSHAEAYEQGKEDEREHWINQPVNEHDNAIRKQLIDELIDDLSLIADMRKKISCKKNDIFDDVIKFIKSKHL